MVGCNVAYGDKCDSCLMTSAWIG